MNYYDLIFSDQRKYRVRRHLLFWITWCLYFALTYLVPFSWVPAWNLNGPMPQIEKYGVIVSCLRILMNSSLMTVVHIALVYGILYYFLPQYLSKSRNRIGITVLLIVFVILIACFNYLNFLMTFSISTRMGYFEKMPDMNYIIPIWIRQIVFNYPTIVGFAVAIKLLKRWYLKQKETEQLVREKINAELQLLKAQVHPHFLFNTLNNIYSFILNDSDRAPEMIKKLSSLLHYILNDCSRQLVPLDKELSMIQDYIALEQIRYGDRLNLSLHIQGTVKDKMISPLLLIPFVENSFKHGTSRMLTHPWVRLDIHIEKDFLEFKLTNNKPEYNNESPGKKGIGLNNVKKRLQLLYPETHSLRIVESDMSYEVVMKIVLHSPEDKIKQDIVTNKKEMYELA
ncbi:MAG TPA: histidine kinase [Chitinophagaceae bacterium]|nr:histidine kinase [Chitinophagaceae bacterium]